MLTDIQMYDSSQYGILYEALLGFLRHGQPFGISREGSITAEGLGISAQKTDEQIEAEHGITPEMLH